MFSSITAAGHQLALYQNPQSIFQQQQAAMLQQQQQQQLQVRSKVKQICHCKSVRIGKVKGQTDMP